MPKYEDGDNTKFAENLLFEIDYESLTILPGKQYIDSLDHSILFQEGVFAKIKELGYVASDDDTNAAIDFIFSLCKEAKVDLSKSTLKNWLEKNPPDGAGRENVYKLCFALKMKVNDAEKFFLKNYLSRPFNFKNTRESVFYYCFLNGKSFEHAQKLIAKIIETEPSISQDNYQIATVSIGRQLDDIKNDEALIKYLSTHRYLEQEQHSTARNRIFKLLKMCYDFATQEIKYDNIEERIEPIINIDGLLEVIYGFNERAMRGENKGIAKSDLPKYVRINFPQRQQFYNIEKNKANDDTIRKALVILVFYNFYATALFQRKNKRFLIDMDLSCYYDDFENELNTILDDCGYIQIYKRNPFDWLMLYCARAKNPLYLLRDVIEVYYLDMVD